MLQHLLHLSTRQTESKNNLILFPSKVLRSTVLFGKGIRSIFFIFFPYFLSRHILYDIFCICSNLIFCQYMCLSRSCNSVTYSKWCLNLLSSFEDDMKEETLSVNFLLKYWKGLYLCLMFCFNMYTK